MRKVGVWNIFNLYFNQSKQMQEKPCKMGLVGNNLLSAYTADLVGLTSFEVWFKAGWLLEK